MSGQIYVDLIPSDKRSHLIAQLAMAANIEVVDERIGGHLFHRCQRGHHALTMESYPDPKNPTETFVVIPYPPYSYRPWRWIHDSRLFDDVVMQVTLLSIPRPPEE